MQTIRKIVLLLAALSLTLGSAFTPLRLQDEDANIRITQVDTSQFPRVTFYVSVVDSEGNPVPVNPGRLVIMENGEPIPLDQIEGIGEVDQLTTLLVMDVSGSMNSVNKLDSAKAAAHQYVDQMRPADQAGLLAFNTQTRVVTPVTSDTEALRAGIDSLAADDDTAMYDALNVAIDQLEGVEGRKAIIVLTDGMDNTSAASAENIIERIGPSGFTISTVGLGVPEGSENYLEGIDEAGLISLAEQTGGVYGHAEDEESLTRLYQSYAVGLQSEYAISYTSPSALRDGVNRALSVDLVSFAGGETVAGQSEAYNPGGLVPEVAQPASWPTFGLLLAVLLALLLIPPIFTAVTERVGGQRLSSSGKVNLKPRPKVKLKD
jgi:VWFA-related protein